MPKYRITTPDGKTYDVTAPDGASKEQVLAKIQGLHVSPQTGNETIPQTYDGSEYGSPADGMAGWEKFAAGAKSKLKDYALGAGQLAGLPLQESIDEKARIDQPLLNTGEGQAGAVAGALLPALLTAPIPGANTYTGAALTGAAMGALDPITSGQDVLTGKLKNAAGGALAGAGGQAAGNVLGAGIKGVMGLVKPLFASGRGEMADALIQQAAHNPQAAINAATSYLPATPGVTPTLAESTLDPGIAALQRSIGGAPVADTHLQNRRVLVDILKSLGGTDDQYKAALAARRSFGETAYPQALDGVRVQNDDALNTLMERPSMQEAVSRALRLGREKGMRLIEGEDIPATTQIIPGQGVPSFPGSQSYQSVSRAEDYIPGETRDVPAEFRDYLAQGLQYMKMSMDDIVKGTGGQGMGAHEAAAVRDTQKALNGWLEERVPAYMDANRQYRELSAPINQMEVGRALYNKAVPALSDAADSVAKLTPGSLARALREGNEALAQDAAGKWGSSIEDILTPEQMKSVQGVVSDLGREQSAYDVALTRGSPTAQNLVTQRVIDQVAGSLGGGKHLQGLVRALTKVPSRMIDAAYAPTSDEVAQEIARRLANSKLGLEALRYQPGSAASDRVADALARLGSPAAIAAYGSQ